MKLSHLTLRESLREISETLEPHERQEIALEFIITGIVEPRLAVSLARTAFEDRTILSDELLLQLGDEELEFPEQQRLTYLTRRLRSDNLSVESFATVMSETRETASHKLGLGTRPFTNGRHSAPETLSAFDRPL